MAGDGSEGAGRQGTGGWGAGRHGGGNASGAAESGWSADGATCCAFCRACISSSSCSAAALSAQPSAAGSGGSGGGGWGAAWQLAELKRAAMAAQSQALPRVSWLAGAVHVCPGDKKAWAAELHAAASESGMCAGAASASEACI